MTDVGIVSAGRYIYSLSPMVLTSVRPYVIPSNSVTIVPSVAPLRVISTQDMDVPLVFVSVLPLTLPLIFPPSTVTVQTLLSALPIAYLAPLAMIVPPCIATELVLLPVPRVPTPIAAEYTLLLCAFTTPPLISTSVALP